MNTRVAYFDFLRGVAILMVVGIHTFPTTSTNISDVAIFIRQILNCAVPVFLAISGFFLGRKQIDNREDRVNFWRKHIPSVYVPCIIWSLPYFVMALVAKEHSILLNVARLVFCGFSVYYFVILIIQCYILLPYLRKIGMKYALVLSMVLSLVAVVSWCYVLNIQGFKVPTTVYSGPFPLLLVYFVLGIYLGQRDRNYCLVWPIVLAFLGLCLEYFETKFLIGFHGNGYESIKVSAYLYSASLIVVLFSQYLEKCYERFSTKLKLVTKVGTMAYGIYLTHFYIIYLVRYLNVGDLPWGIEWGLVVIVTALVIASIKKIVPQFSVKYLGFR